MSNDTLSAKEQVARTVDDLLNELPSVETDVLREAYKGLGLLRRAIKNELQDRKGEEDEQ